MTGVEGDGCSTSSRTSSRRACSASATTPPGSRSSGCSSPSSAMRSSGSVALGREEARTRSRHAPPSAPSSRGPTRCSGPPATRRRWTPCAPSATTFAAPWTGRCDPGSRRRRHRAGDLPGPRVVLAHGWLSGGGAALARPSRRGRRSTNDPVAFRALHRMAVLVQQQGRYDEAAALLDRCLAHWESSGDLAEQARVLNSLGVGERGRGDIELARTHYRRAAELARDRRRHRTGVDRARQPRRARGAARPRGGAADHGGGRRARPRPEGTAGPSASTG